MPKPRTSRALRILIRQAIARHDARMARAHRAAFDFYVMNKSC